MPRLRSWTRLIAVTLAASLGARAAAAQTCLITGANGTCSLNVTTSVTIPTILRVTESGSSTSFGAITATEYLADSVRVTGPTVTVKANQAWRVQISSSATFWTASGGARANKPLSDLGWSTLLAGPYTNVTGTGTNFASGTRTGGNATTLKFQSKWDATLDTPGNYSVVVTFTLLSP